MIAFWILGPVMVAAALGILFARKAVHAALLLAVVMIGLAMLYAVQDAPFLFAVQIIVYTGAILMLFLFVLMLVGVDASDSRRRDDQGPAGAWPTVVGLLFGLILVLGVGAGRPSAPSSASTRPTPTATSRGLAQLLFTKYVFAFEATSALLITAAIGAMVLAHRERLTPKVTPGRPGRPADARLRRARQAPRPAAGPGRLRPAQRRRHPGPAAGRHRRLESSHPARVLGRTAGDVSARRRALGRRHRGRCEVGPRGGIDGDPSDSRHAAPTDRRGGPR